jgi:hypothetical protein
MPRFKPAPLRDLEVPPAPADTPAPATSKPALADTPTSGTMHGLPAVLWPLAWLNGLFDLCLLPLGPLGRWFRGSAGRNLLGTVGVLCLLAALALVALDWFGWTW